MTQTQNGGPVVPTEERGRRTETELRKLGFDPTDGTGGALAAYVPGAMAIERCLVDEELTGHRGRRLCTLEHHNSVLDAFGPEAARTVSQLYIRLRAPIGVPTELGEVPALPAAILPESVRPTRAEVSEWCAATRTRDPHAYIAELERRQTAEEAEATAPGAPPDAALFDYARDFANLRAPEELIPGLIETGSAVQVIAEPNVGKTFLALAWSCHLAVSGRSVIYVVADDSVYQFVRRVLGWCAAHDVAPPEVFAHLQLFTRAAQFTDETDMSALEALVIERESVLVVFDTQHQCSEGIQENSNDDSQMITKAIKRLTKHGPSVALVHHTGDGKTGRGAKSVHGYLTTVLSVAEIEQDSQRYLKVTASKQKNMEKGKPVLYPLERVEIPEGMCAGVIADEHRSTLVARTRTDPFDTAGVESIESIRRYCTLWALSTTPDPVAPTRAAMDAKDHAKPILAHKGLLSPKGNMPRGFARADISNLLMELTKEGLTVESAGSGQVTKYGLTPSGEAEQLTLAKLLRADGENGH